jgi:hypothetical protein
MVGNGGRGFEADGLIQVTTEDEGAITSLLRVRPLNRGVAHTGDDDGPTADLTVERFADTASRGSVRPGMESVAFRSDDFHGGLSLSD